MDRENDNKDAKGVSEEQRDPKKNKNNNYCALKASETELEIMRKLIAEVMEVNDAQDFGKRSLLNIEKYFEEKRDPESTAKCVNSFVLLGGGWCLLNFMGKWRTYKKSKKQSDKEETDWTEVKRAIKILTFIMTKSSDKRLACELLSNMDMLKRINDILKSKATPADVIDSNLGLLNASMPDSIIWMNGQINWGSTFVTVSEQKDLGRDSKEHLCWIIFHFAEVDRLRDMLITSGTFRFLAQYLFEQVDGLESQKRKQLIEYSAGRALWEIIREDSMQE